MIYAAKSTIEDLKNKIREVTKKQGSSCEYDVTAVMADVFERKANGNLDFNFGDIKFGNENCSGFDNKDKFGFGIGFHQLENFALALVASGDDSEMPVHFFIYLDTNNELDIYVPRIGNTYNKYTNTAFGSEDEHFSEEELLQKMPKKYFDEDNCLFEYEPYDEFTEHIWNTTDYYAMLADAKDNISCVGGNTISIDKKYIDYENARQKFEDAYEDEEKEIRTAKKCTIKELKKKLIEITQKKYTTRTKDEFSLNAVIKEICENGFNDDFRDVGFDCSNIADPYNGNCSVTGEHSDETGFFNINGTAVMIGAGCRDSEYGIYCVIYLDENGNFRVYIPKYGNTYNKFENCGFSREEGEGRNQRNWAYHLACVQENNAENNKKLFDKAIEKYINHIMYSASSDVMREELKSVLKVVDGKEPIPMSKETIKEELKRWEYNPFKDINEKGFNNKDCDEEDDDNNDGDDKEYDPHFDICEKENDITTFKHKEQTYNVNFINSDGHGKFYFEIKINNKNVVEIKSVVISMHDNNHEGLEDFCRDVQDRILEIVSYLIVKADEQYKQQVFGTHDIECSKCFQCKNEQQEEDIEKYKPTNSWEKMLMNMW